MAPRHGSARGCARMDRAGGGVPVGLPARVRHSQEACAKPAAATGSTSVNHTSGFGASYAAWTGNGSVHVPETRRLGRLTVGEPDVRLR